MALEQIQAMAAPLIAFLQGMPAWVLGWGLIALAVIAALAVHGLATWLANRIIGTRHAFLRSLISHTQGPTRLALITFAVSGAMHSTSFDPAVTNMIDHVLAIAFIALMGWIAIVAARLAATVYLRRFQIDVEDNLLARKHVTQIRILERVVDSLIILITVAAALMTFDPVRQYGVSLFASAGVAGLAVGLAARPLLSNLIAGIQLAMTQPIRLEDAILVENEFGWVEEIASTYVVIRIWDLRRLIVPLSYFIEKPFQNWTHRSGELIGSVFLYVDYSAPVDRIRDKFTEVVSQSGLWDKRVATLQVTAAKETTIELRALVSARSSSVLSDLTAEVREKLIGFLQQQYPGALPRRRTDVGFNESTLSALQSGQVRTSAA